MLDIKYMILNFRIIFNDDCRLNRNKTSAIRGALGTALMNDYCIGDGKCNICGFTEDCIITNLMSCKLKVDLPKLVKDSTASSFILECSNMNENFKKGDSLDFRIILLGNVIINYSIYIKAVEKMGSLGLNGKNNAFTLLNVLNEKREKLYSDGVVNKRAVLIKTVYEYVKYRKNTLGEMKEIKFLTPFRVKRNGKIVDNIKNSDIINAAIRRIKILNALQGKEMEYIETSESDTLMEPNYQKWVDIKRYSNNQGSYMKFGGVVGQYFLSEEMNPYVDYLIACELLHIGKNTSFGLGKYKLI